MKRRLPGLLLAALLLVPAAFGALAADDKGPATARDIILAIPDTPRDELAIAASDILLDTDTRLEGEAIMDACAGWGAEVFVHYSFPRDLAAPEVSAQRDVLMARAQALGIAFQEVAMPDPTAGEGLAEQFFSDDVPVQLERLKGKRVAFFVTDSAMKGPLQAATLDHPDAFCP